MGHVGCYAYFRNRTGKVLYITDYPDKAELSERRGRKAQDLKQET